jgi:hypothetical protein
VKQIRRLLSVSMLCAGAIMAGATQARADTLDCGSIWVDCYIFCMDKGGIRSWRCDPGCVAGCTAECWCNS